MATTTHRYIPSNDPTGSGGGSAPGNGTLRDVEIFTLTGTEITNKQVTLSTTPTDLNKTRLTVIGGPEQEYGVDFTVSGTTLSWNTLGLDGVLESGDKLIVDYN